MTLNLNPIFFATLPWNFRLKLRCCEFFFRTCKAFRIECWFSRVLFFPLFSFKLIFCSSTKWCVWMVAKTKLSIRNKIWQSLRIWNFLWNDQKSDIKNNLNKRNEEWWKYKGSQQCTLALCVFLSIYTALLKMKNRKEENTVNKSERQNSTRIPWSTNSNCNNNE